MTYSIIPLSASTDGLPVGVTGIVTANAVVVHTAVNATGDYDEIALLANNISENEVILTLEFHEAGPVITMATTTPSGAGVAQVDTISVISGDTGDSFIVTIGGTPSASVSWTTSAAATLALLKIAIDALSLAVTTAVVGNTMTITANVVNTPFVATAAATDSGTPAVSKTIKRAIPAESTRLVLEDAYLSSGKRVKAFASVANVINLYGKVGRSTI